MKKLAVLFLVAGIAAGFLGCSKSSPTSNTVTVHDTTYVNQAKIVLASIDASYNGFPLHYSLQEWVDIFSDPTANIAQSSAQIKAGGTSFYCTWDSLRMPGAIGFADTIPVPYPGIPCSLIVNTNLGSGRAGGVSIPGGYTLSTPRNGDTLAWGDLVVAWSPSQYATWYDLYIDYAAYNGMTLLGYAYTELFPTSTSTVVPLSFFRQYSGATYVSAWLYVDAWNGPSPAPGGSGNVTGEFKGFFNCSFSDTSNSASFYMGSPKAPLGASPAPPRISREERRERLLKAFKAKFQSEAN
jgi:hypothetical protein